MNPRIAHGHVLCSSTACINTGCHRNRKSRFRVPGAQRVNFRHDCTQFKEDKPPVPLPVLPNLYQRLMAHVQG